MLIQRMLVLPKSPLRLSPHGSFYLPAYANKFGQIKKPRHYRVRVFVPGTGFEPAHPCERCHLKAVRLPISPPGQGDANINDSNEMLKSNWIHEKQKPS